jgi:hypothetical protein
MDATSGRQVSCAAPRAAKRPQSCFITMSCSSFSARGANNPGFEFAGGCGYATFRDDPVRPADEMVLEWDSPVPGTDSV